MVRQAYTKEPVGAHYGIGNWLVQRFTAVVMAVYTVLAISYLCWKTPASYADWHALLTGGFFRLATMLFLAALIWHAWIGMRDILIDYVHPFGLRILTQGAVAIVLVFYVIWSVSILWGAPR
jgi:succinate dehydrogenase / fumarate reductase membrane anchor subunit